MPNFKNFHRQLSEIFLIEIYIFQKFRGYKIAICACASLTSALALARRTSSILCPIVACLSCDSLAVFSSPGCARKETLSSHLKDKMSLNAKTKNKKIPAHPTWKNYDGWMLNNFFFTWPNYTCPFYAKYLKYLLVVTLNVA